MRDESLAYRTRLVLREVEKKGNQRVCMIRNRIHSFLYLRKPNGPPNTFNFDSANTNAHQKHKNQPALSECTMWRFNGRQRLNHQGSTYPYKCVRVPINNEKQPKCIVSHGIQMRQQDARGAFLSMFERAIMTMILVYLYTNPSVSLSLLIKPTSKTREKRNKPSQFACGSLSNTSSQSLRMMLNPSVVLQHSENKHSIEQRTEQTPI